MAPCGDGGSPAIGQRPSEETRCPERGRVSEVMTPSPLNRIPYLHRVDWQHVPVWSHEQLKVRERVESTSRRSRGRQIRQRP